MQNRLAKASLIFLAIFLAANIFVGLIYSKRIFPRTSVGPISIGNSSYNETEKRLSQAVLLQKEIKFSHKDKQSAYTTEELGLKVDRKKIMDDAKYQPWLPLVSLLRAHKVKVHLSLDENQFDKILPSIKSKFETQPVNAEIVIKNGLFSLNRNTTDVCCCFSKPSSFEFCCAFLILGLVVSLFTTIVPF